MTGLKIDTPFSVAVRSRVSRANWGSVAEELFDDNVHHQEHKMFDPKLQMDVCGWIMKWHLVQVRSKSISMNIRHFLTCTSHDQQGQDVYVDRNPRIKFTKFLAEPPKKIESAIYVSLADVPPDRKDESVREAFRLTWDMQIDWESLPLFINNQQKTFRKLEYEVEMKCSAGATSFAIYHGGYKQVGRNVDLTVYETADV